MAHSQWTSFVDLFDGAVDSNANLSSSQKLFYLKGLLTGEAKRLSAITITDANYGEARTMLLQERYENRRAIVREHISSIVTASTATKEAGSLRNLMQTADEHRRALEALGLNMDEMDIYTVYHVEKTDAESRREWELEHSGTDLLKYEDLHKFLITRCRALEAAHGSKQSTNRGIEFGQAQSGGKRNHSLSVTQTNKGPQCKQAHGLYACDDFKKTVDNRRNFVKDKGLCFNCLRSGQTAKDCSMKKCKLCTKSHNTMLHINQNNVAASVASDETTKTSTCT